MHVYLKDRCHVFMTAVIFTGRPLSRYCDSCVILNSTVLRSSLALFVVVSWQWQIVLEMLFDIDTDDCINSDSIYGDSKITRSLFTSGGSGYREGLTSGQKT